MFTYPILRKQSTVIFKDNVLADTSKSTYIILPEHLTNMFNKNVLTEASKSTCFDLPNLLTSMFVENVLAKPGMSIKFVKTAKIKAVVMQVKDCKRNLLCYI